MKEIFLSLLLMLPFANIHSQQFTPPTTVLNYKTLYLASINNHLKSAKKIGDTIWNLHTEKVVTKKTRETSKAISFKTTYIINSQKKDYSIEKNNILISTDKIKRFGIYGLGSVGDDIEENLSASTKFNFYVKPYISGLAQIGFNKSASTSDSVKLLFFPERGVSAFSFYYEAWYFSFLGWNNKDDSCDHYITPFVDYSIRTPGKAVNDSTQIQFTTSKYSFGLKYYLIYHPTVDDNLKKYFSFTSLQISPFVNCLVISKDDINNFQAAYNLSDDISNLWSIGQRTEITLGYFSVFFQTNEIISKLSSEDRQILKGFNYTIGTSFSSPLIEL